MHAQARTQRGTGGRVTTLPSEPFDHARHTFSAGRHSSVIVVVGQVARDLAPQLALLLRHCDEWTQLSDAKRRQVGH